MAQGGYKMVFLLAFCVLCSNLISLTEGFVDCVNEVGYMYEGHDIADANYPTDNSWTWETCANICAKNSECTHWSMTTGTKWAQNYCMLKTSNSGRRSDPSTISGNRFCGQDGCFQPGVDLHGGDVGGSFCSYGAESAEECQDFCLDNYECSFFTYVPAGPLSDRACCWLKAETGWTIKENAGVISGPKYCDDDEYGSGDSASGDSGSGSGPVIPPQDQYGFENKIRLVDSGDHGGPALKGRLEIFQGEWGTVCNDDFTDDEAQVACRQLGLTGGKAFNLYDDNNIAEGTGPIWLDNVSCSSSDNDLSKCNHNGFGQHDCGHFEDVGVACDLPENYYDY